MGDSAAVEHQILVRALLGGVFAGASAYRLAALAKETFFPAGKLLFGAGEQARQLYFILEGRVELTAPGEEPWTFGSSSLVGILDAELDRPHARTARALTDLRAVVLGAEDWLDVVEDNFELTRQRIRRNAVDLLERGLSLTPSWGFDADEGPRQPSLLAPAPAGREQNRLEQLLALRLCPLFARSGTQPLIRLLRGASPREVAAGDVLVGEGALMTSLFVVSGGTLLLLRETPPLEAAFAAPALCGGYAGFGQERWPGTVRAINDARVLAIRYEDLYDVMEDHFDVVRSVMAFLAEERERLQKQLAPRA